MELYTNYEEWHHAITKVGGFDLTSEFCNQRIEALQNEDDPSTKSFVQLYGAPYRDQVVQWFQQTLSNL